MPVAGATAEMLFSVLRRLKTYVRSTMKNDRLSSLGLMHILTELLKSNYPKMDSAKKFANTVFAFPRDD
jgi:hypothetical protein